MIRRLAVSLAGWAIVSIVLAAPASAHVSVNPDTATKGSFAKLTLRVPTEEDVASTVKLEVRFPDPSVAPLASASVQPHPGWSYKIDKTHLATPVKSDDGDVTDVVSLITWTADSAANGIKPGEFDEFSVSAGPLPTTVDSLEFRVVQTYSNGDVVRWIDPTTPGAAEPQHPAPVLTLVAGTDSVGSAAPTEKAAPIVSKSSVDQAKTFAVVGIVIGALGLLAAIGALVVARKRAA